MATPHVAGIAALYVQQNPSITGQELWDRLGATAQRLGAPAIDVGTGLVQIV